MGWFGLQSVPDPEPRRPLAHGGVGALLALGEGAQVGRMVLPQLLAALEQVVQTGLVQSVVAAIRRPPVAHEHAGVVGPQHRGGIVEPPAGADGVDRRVRGVQRQLLWPPVLPHLRMLPVCLRKIVPTFFEVEAASRPTLRSS